MADGKVTVSNKTTATLWIVVGGSDNTKPNAGLTSGSLTSDASQAYPVSGYDAYRVGFYYTKSAVDYNNMIWSDIVKVGQTVTIAGIT